MAESKMTWVTLANGVSSSPFVVSYVDFPLATPGQTYSIKITPVNGGDAAGAPVTTTFTMPLSNYGVAMPNVARYANLVAYLPFASSSTLPSVTATTVDSLGSYPIANSSTFQLGMAAPVLPMRGSWDTQHAMVVGSDGSLWCAGSNSWGQLGLGYSGGTVNTWTRVPGIGNVRKVACGDRHTIALCADGSVWTWGTAWGVGIGGSNRYSPAVLLWGAVDVTAGNQDAVVIMADGTMRVWGYGYGIQNGSLGNGFNNSLGTIGTPWQPTVPTNMQNVVGASVGNWLVYAVCADGSLWSPIAPLLTWQQIAPAGTYIQVAAGGPSGGPGLALLRANGVVDTSSANNSGIPAAGTNGLTNAVQINNGYSHTVALLSNGTVVSWGTNEAGQFGNAATSTVNTKIPQPAVGIVGNVVGVMAGKQYTMALTDVGDLYVAGDNSYGQLGLGSNIANSNVFVLSASWASSVSSIATPLMGPLWGNPAIASVADRGYVFAASGGYLSLTGFAHPTSYTKSAWVNFTTLGSTQYVLGTDMGATAIHGFAFSDKYFANLVNFTAFHGAASGNVDTGNIAVAAALPIDTWTHVCATYDNPSTTLRMYTNGQLVNTIVSGNIAWSGGGGMQIGAHLGTPYFGSGYVDNIRVYDAALTAADVGNLYAWEQCYTGLGSPTIPAVSNVVANVGTSFANGVSISLSASNAASLTLFSNMISTKVAAGPFVIPACQLVPAHTYSLTIKPLAPSGFPGNNVVVGFTTPSYVGALPPTANLIAWLPFGYPTPPTTDALGNPLTYFGPLANLTLDPACGYVSSNTTTQINVHLPPSYTKALWVRCNGKGLLTQCFINSEWNTTGGGIHSLAANGALTTISAGHSAANSGAMTQITANIVGVANLMTWTHVACTFNSPSNVMTLYVNGSNVLTGTVAVAGWAAEGGLRPQVGNQNATAATISGLPLVGVATGVRIYGRALVASEISNIYSFESATL